MKKILFIAFIILTAHSTGAAQTLDSLWDKANAAYAGGNFAEAVAAYTEIEKSGNVSADLYFNTGNAYFKQKQLPEAILYYERANKLQPEDKDILHNLTIARAQTLDKVEVVPDFIVSTWVKELRSTVGTDTWAAFALVFLAACLLLFLLFFFARNVRLRKFSFFLAVISIALTTICFVFASEQKKEMMDTSEAIIFPAVVTVKSAPNQDGKDLFILHEGAKVKILEELRDWQRIQLPDGKDGWVLSSATQRI